MGKGWIGIVLALVCAGSFGAGAVIERDGKSSSPASSRSAPDGAAGLVPGLNGTRESAPAPTSEDPTAIEKAIPVVSQTSFFALIGFALGYFSRKVLKVGLILVAMLFLGVQGLQMAGIIENVNWNRAYELFNSLVVRIKGEQPFTEIIKNQIPAAGGMVAGYWLGFRKG